MPADNRPTAYGRDTAMRVVRAAKTIEGRGKSNLAPQKRGRHIHSPGGDHYQVICGATVTAVTPLDLYFQVTSVTEFEELAKLPAAPVWVACQGGVTLGLGDLAWAVYHKGYATFTYHEGEEDEAEITVDWVYLPTAAAASTPPLRRFELTVAKATTDATATAKWLDDAGSMVGSDVTLYDPTLKFYGKAAGYLSGEDGFRGVAILRADLAESDPEADRWEIVDMEGFANWVVVQYVGSPDNNWQLISFGGDQWNWHRPEIDGGVITISDPLAVVSSPAAGDKIIAELKDPDSSPPTYQERERQGGGDTTIKFGKAYSIISAATDWALADAGTGDWQELDTDGDAVGSPVEVQNRYFDEIPEGSPVFVKDGIVLNSGCTAGPA